MKSFNLSKVVGAGVLVASLATLPLALPASAQTETLRDSSQAAPGDIATYGDGETDKGSRSFDWGWLGVLGLLGLAGRLAKHRTEPVVYREHNEINRSVTTEEAVRYRDPQEMNRLDTTEKAVRYRDPKEMNRPGTDGTSNR